MPWDPSGVYTVVPAASYSCALGLVNFSFATTTLSDGGSIMVATATGLPCSPTGASARATRTFDLTCTAPGSCAETYRLQGTFSDDRHWSGTITASYVGGASCLGCMNQSWTVSGSR